MSDNSHLIQLDNMGNILSNIGNKLIQNKTLMRCIYYDHTDALSTSLPDVPMSEIIKLVGKGQNPNGEQRIFKFLTNDNIIDETRTELRFGISSIKPESLYIAELPVTLQIIIHNSLWELKDNKIRAFVMINELLKDLNGNFEDIKGIGELKLVNPIGFVIFNKSFSGYIINLSIRTQ